MYAFLATYAEFTRRQVQSAALAWGDDDPDAGDSDSEDGDGGGGAGAALSKERTEVEEAKEQAEAEARETAEEKRLRLARDVLMKLDAEQRENVGICGGVGDCVFGPSVVPNQALIPSNVVTSHSPRHEPCYLDKNRGNPCFDREHQPVLNCSVVGIY